MKKTLIFLVLNCAFIYIHAQFVVEDPAVAGLITTLNTQVQTNQLTNQMEFVQQTTSLAQTLEHLKEVKERLQKVNAIINQAVFYKQTLTIQLTIIKYQVYYISNLKEDDHVTVKEIATVNEMFGDMLTRTEKLLAFATDILTDSKYEMNDSERLSQLKKINEEMTGILNELNMTITNLDNVRKERELIEILDNW